MPDRATLLLAAAVATVALTACGRDAPAAGAVDGGKLVDDLCTAAAADSVDDARRAFRNAHGPLHDLARDVVESDRRIAAQLHEAKHQSEDALGAGDADELGRSLGELVDATYASLRTLGQPVSGCDDRNAP